MARPTSPSRLVQPLLAPLLMLLVAAATLAATGRRRPGAAPAAAPALEPGPLTAGAVEDFECVTTGRSALLRVHVAGGADPDGAVLVVDRGASIELLGALPAPMTGGALGFACARETVEAGRPPVFFLQLAGATHALGTPRARVL